MSSIPGRQKPRFAPPIDAGIIMVSKQDCKQKCNQSFKGSGSTVQGYIKIGSEVQGSPFKVVLKPPDPEPCLPRRSLLAKGVPMNPGPL